MPRPLKCSSPSRNSNASCLPLDAPDGTEALPKPPSSKISASTVGLPLLSIICLPINSIIFFSCWFHFFSILHHKVQAYGQVIYIQISQIFFLKAFNLIIKEFMYFTSLQINKVIVMISLSILIWRFFIVKFNAL